MSASAFDFYDLGSKILVGVITGGFAAWIASTLALRKFYREKWWDKNYEAYLTLIDDLIYMRNIYEKLYIYEESKLHDGARVEKKPDIDRERMSTINERMEKHLYTAALTLSKPTSDAIKKFLHDTKLIDQQVDEYSMHVYEAYENLCGIAAQLLNSVVHDARENLGLISLTEKFESMDRD